MEKKNIGIVGCSGIGNNLTTELLANSFNNINLIKEQKIIIIISLFKDADYDMLTELSQEKLDYLLENALAGKYLTFLNAINDEQRELETKTLEDYFIIGTEVTKKTKQKSWNKKKFWE